MHELILGFYRQAPPGSFLARLPLDEGGLVACWEPGASRMASPCWLAKTASGRLGVQRLAAEARALSRLDAVAAALGVPRLLGWLGPSEAPTQAASLVQSGVAGRRLECIWNPRRPWRPLPAALLAAGDWLVRFQRLVPPPRQASLAQLTAEAQEWAQADAGLHPEAAPLLHALRGLLPPLLRQAGEEAADLAGVAIHGDFWPGNILVAPGQRPTLHSLRVVDWSGFATATPLHDLLTFVGQVSLRAWRRRPDRLEGWLAAYFSPGSMRDYLRAQAQERGFSESAARLAFYLFLLERMSWELGLRLQWRNAEERRGAQRNWSRLLSWMAQHRYPDPFTPLPV